MSAAEPDPAAPAPGDTGVDRGRLAVALAVVRAVAERTADLTEGSARSRGHGGPGTTARVRGQRDVVDLHLDVPLAYPVPVPTTVRAVRRHVADRVHALTGYTVRNLDVRVSALVAGPAEPDTPPDPDPTAAAPAVAAGDGPRAG